MNNLIEVKQTHLAGLYVIATKPHEDNRGSFRRLFCERDWSTILQSRNIVQINYSQTKSIGAIRGLHFQRQPYSEMKIVRCLKGRVWDVAVDVRQNSSTFLKWQAQELSPDNGLVMVIPEGFAHGFQVLESGSELLYLHTAFHKPDAEDGISFNDPKISINWPLEVTDISQRDLSHPKVSDLFEGQVV